MSLSNVFAALAYYDGNRANIDDSIRSDEAFAAELKKESSSILTEKLNGAPIG